MQSFGISLYSKISLLAFDIGEKNNMSMACPHGRGTPENPDCYLCWTQQNPIQVTGHLKPLEHRSASEIMEEHYKNLKEKDYKSQLDRIEFLLTKGHISKKFHCAHCGKSTIVEI